MKADKAAYDRIFEAEAGNAYPAIDEFEAECGHAIGKERLEALARELACPLKVNPPNWQHGRVLYSALRRYLAESERPSGDLVNIVDVGTAKGFSALVMARAASDAGVDWSMTSVDVIDPSAKCFRNTVAEAEEGGPLTLREIVAPYEHSDAIRWRRSDGSSFLAARKDRVHFAFLDGKHVFEAVDAELHHLARWQVRGDVVVLDDLQIDGVRRALGVHRVEYEAREVAAKPDRCYAVCTRR